MNSDQRRRQLPAQHLKLLQRQGPHQHKPSHRQVRPAPADGRGGANVQAGSQPASATARRAHHGPAGRQAAARCGHRTEAAGRAQVAGPARAGRAASASAPAGRAGPCAAPGSFDATVPARARNYAAPGLARLRAAGSGAMQSATAWAAAMSTGRRAGSCGWVSTSV